MTQSAQNVTAIRRASALFLTALLWAFLLALAPISALADEELTVESNLQSQDIALIAHRGINEQGQPENTLAAFRSAASNPIYYGVEFDIWESLAEPGDVPLLLVNHDEDISSTYDAPNGTNVRTITRANRTSYRNRDNGAALPTMEEALDALWSTSSSIVPIIELKGSTRMPGSGSGTAEFMSDRAIAYAVDYVGKHGTEVYFISFSYDAVRTVEQVAAARGYRNVHTMFLDPGIHVLDDDPYEFPRRMAADGIDGISMAYATITGADVVARYNDAGVFVGSYEVPHLIGMEHLDAMGVDFVTPLTNLKDTSDCGGNHQWDGGAVTREPTCEETGVTTYTCSECGMPRHEPIEALGHEWGDWVVTTQATTTETGVETRTCQRDPSHTESRQTPLIPEYRVLEEDGKVYTQGSGRGLALAFQRSLYGAVSLGLPSTLAVDGVALEADSYATTVGKVLTLKPAYLETLATGKHTLTASFEDGGQTTVSFTVAEAVAEAEAATAMPTIPEDTVVLVGIILACVVLLIVIIVAVRRRKRS